MTAQILSNAMLLSIQSSAPLKREGSFFISLGLHALAIMIALVAASASVPVAVRRTASTALVAPVLPIKPLHKTPPKPIPQAVANPVIATKTPKPRLFTAPRVEQSPVNDAKIYDPEILMEPRPVPVASTPVIPAVIVPGPPIRTGNLSPVSVAPLETPSRTTSVGGFAVSDHQQAAPRQVALVQQGAFSSSAIGASSPGSRIVKSAGIDSGSPASTVVPSRTIRASAFGNTVADTAPRPADRAATRPNTRDVEILAKPRPQYTDEARKKQVEGDVALEILFGRTGEVRVLRVIRGLGFGLDESAIRAAEGIRFRPAENAGIAVDSTATVRIQFQLAF